MRADNFELFWQEVGKRREQLKLDEPQLPRKHKCPRQCEQGNTLGEFATAPNDEYSQVYFEAVDLPVTCIQRRFDQKGFKIFSTVEQVLFKACGSHCFREELNSVCDFFYDDFKQEDLKSELSTFHKLYHVATDGVPSVDNIKAALLTLSTSQQKLLSTACHLFQLLMILPATNSTS